MHRCGRRQCRSGCWRNPEANTKTAVFAPLLLDLADMNVTDLGSGSNVCAATRLRVDLAFLTDTNEPDPAAAHRGTHILGFDQCRISDQFLIGNPARENRMI